MENEQDVVLVKVGIIRTGKQHTAMFTMMQQYGNSAIKYKTCIKTWLYNQWILKTMDLYTPWLLHQWIPNNKYVKNNLLSDAEIL